LHPINTIMQRKKAVNHPFNIFVGTATFFQDTLVNRKFNRTAFILNRIFCKIINIFTVTLLINASLQKN